MKDSEEFWKMREQEVKEALRAFEGEWAPRAKIAHALGRKRLNPLDLAALRVLEVTGQIEVEKRPDPRPIGFITLYRLKG